jgi:DNA sulfur modification protein DndC
MTALLDFRNYIGDADNDRARRDFRRMTGQAHLYRGRLVHGPYKKSIREEWLRKLLQVQKEINETGPKEFQSLELITNEELNLIRQIWLDEKNEFDDSLPGIYKEVTGEDFRATTWHSPSSFGSEEWNLLADVCRDLFPDEELLFETTAKIVDIERKSAEQKQRRGVANSVEHQIKKGFFMNEKDAFNYARDKYLRKKDMGADYDPRAAAPDEELDTEENIFGGEGVK